MYKFRYKKLYIQLIFGLFIFCYSSKANVIQDHNHAIWCLPEKTCIKLEVANTVNKQKIGLMFRKELKKNNGMIFIFSPKQKIKFWMKNTYIPLDMIFIKNKRILDIIKDAQPCKQKKCPLYGPDFSVDSVIEIYSGEANRLNLKEGDLIDIIYMPKEETIN